MLVADLPHPIGEALVLLIPQPKLDLPRLIDFSLRHVPMAWLRLADLPDTAAALGDHPRLMGSRDDEPLAHLLWRARLDAVARYHQVTRSDGSDPYALGPATAAVDEVASDLHRLIMREIQCFGLAARYCHLWRFAYEAAHYAALAVANIAISERRWPPGSKNPQTDAAIVALRPTRFRLLRAVNELRFPCNDA